MNIAYTDQFRPRHFDTLECFVLKHLIVKVMKDLIDEVQPEKIYIKMKMN